ncbi:MAG: formylglycine-generating enzyme family protein [Acidimicrobiia bacterium]|nr:formylglycine-generating enzyme family protein [Acidimicrobiia bacterium]
MKWLRLFSLLIAGVLVASACGVIGGDEAGEADEADEGGGEEIDAVEADVSIANARLTVRSERDSVTVNGDQLASGTFQDGAPGDVIEVDAAGSATIAAESVFEIEALRGANVTIPELSSSPLDVGLAVGHVFVRLDPAANASLVIDAGDRKFITRSPDASFALCQAPNGASCLAVLSGQVEWNEDGVASEIYNAGEASFAAQGNAPDPPRCADQAAIGEMQRSLRGQDFAGTLADIVGTWDQCTESDELVEQVASLPSAARMEHVVLPEIVIGSSDVDADTQSSIAEKTLDGSADYYIEPLAVTNGEFRSWLATTAGDDPDLWRQYAPQDWLDRAPNNAATQASYADGTADESVKGVAFDTAVAYCAAQAKELPTEVQWELAAVNEIIRDVEDEAQDWVSDWESYGPGPDDSEGRQVLRGANGVLAADPYFRVFAPIAADATAARQNARIRCAAAEVAVGGPTFANEVLRDDFNGLGWPTVDGEVFELDYHPDNYHLDLTEDHGQGTVVRALAEPIANGRIDVDLFIERNNTGVSAGDFRFGTVFGTADELRLLTIQPDNFAGDRFLACVVPMGADLVAELALENRGLTADDAGHYASVVVLEGQSFDDCRDAETSQEVAVTSIDSPVQLTIVVKDGQEETWVNEVLVNSGPAPGPIDTYGFYSEIFHRDRTHIHYDNLVITSG